MRCADFDRWLDEGSPRAEEGEALAHAGGCARCAAALDSARALDDALASYSIAAPPQFAARVMERVRRAPRVERPARAASYATPAPAMDWWVRAAADPASALALLLAGLLAWRANAAQHAALAFAQGLLANARPWLDRLTSGSGMALPRLAVPLGDPNVMLALLLAVAPAMLWISWRLFAWTEHACIPSARVSPRDRAMPWVQPESRRVRH